MRGKVVRVRRVECVVRVQWEILLERAIQLSSANRISIQRLFYVPCCFIVINIQEWAVGELIQCGRVCCIWLLFLYVSSSFVAFYRSLVESVIFLFRYFSLIHGCPSHYLSLLCAIFRTCPFKNLNETYHVIGHTCCAVANQNGTKLLRSVTQLRLIPLQFLLIS